MRRICATSHFVFLTFATRFSLASVDMHRGTLLLTPESFVIRVVGTTSWLRLPASTYKQRSDFVYSERPLYLGIPYCGQDPPVFRRQVAQRLCIKLHTLSPRSDKSQEVISNKQFQRIRATQVFPERQIATIVVENAVVYEARFSTECTKVEKCV
jgi:hypothetical protein